MCFFFSSRRRHTRSLCDWSSDVCSSDLGVDSKKRQRGGVRRGAVVSYWIGARRPRCPFRAINEKVVHLRGSKQDRKSTRLNSSHTVISYAVFCLKKKKKKKQVNTQRTHQ